MNRVARALGSTRAGWPFLNWRSAFSRHACWHPRHAGERSPHAAQQITAAPTRTRALSFDGVLAPLQAAWSGVAPGTVT